MGVGNEQMTHGFSNGFVLASGSLEHGSLDQDGFQLMYWLSISSSPSVSLSLCSYGI